MSRSPGIDAAFVLVDKAGDWTSHDVVAKARGLFSMKKVGHAGTLDPMATGLVVLGLGRATRLLRFVQSQPKEYVATARFGVATDSLDADGAILDRTPMDITEAEVAAVAGRFMGEILQIPPMVSAIRIGGRRLYEVARQGQEVERPPRPVTIYRLDIEGFAPGPYPEVSFRVVCGTGTYVRSLADDMARALGGHAHLIALRRVRNGSLEVRNAWSIDDLVEMAAADRLEEVLLFPGDALDHMARMDATDEMVPVALAGRRLPIGLLEGEASVEFVRVIGGGRLLGVYRIDGKELVPEVVLG